MDLLHIRLCLPKAVAIVNAPLKQDGSYVPCPQGVI
jgi:hypothetical protein